MAITVCIWTALSYEEPLVAKPLAISPKSPCVFVSAVLIQEEMGKDWPICKGENVVLENLRRGRGFHQDDLFLPPPL